MRFKKLLKLQIKVVLHHCGNGAVMCLPIYRFRNFKCLMQLIKSDRIIKRAMFVFRCFIRLLTRKTTFQFQLL